MNPTGFSVTLDGVDILDYNYKEKTLLEPQLEVELNTTDSFTFKMPPIHASYGNLTPLVSIVEVYEDGDMIWFGRVLSVETDYYREKEVTCEGPYGFFNDSVQRYHVYEEVSLHEFFNTLISNHNAQVPEARRFTVGDINVSDKIVYRKLDYESTKSALETMIIDAEGGYLFFRRENGVNYIDWLNDMPYTCNQPVEFGLNMTNLTSRFDGEDLITCILPLGDTVRANDDPDKGEIIPESDERVGKPLNLAHDYGTDLIASEAVNTYGAIIEVVTFSGIFDSAELKDKAEKYLKDEMYDRLTFECEAVELKKFGPGANDNYDHFKVGQLVRCKSRPHALDQFFPLIKMSVQLDTAVKTVTLGTAPRQKLTEIVKNG